MFLENFKRATNVLSYLHEYGLFINGWVTETRLPREYPFTVKWEAILFV